MRFRRYSRLAAFGVAFGTGGISAAADPYLTPTGGFGHRNAAPVTVLPSTTCPPAGTTPAPATPGTAPPTTMPGPDGQPLNLPPTFGSQPGTTPDAFAQAANGSLAQSTQGGGGAEATALPQVFGDLFAGGAFAGPLPARVASNGQLVTPIVVVTPNGQRITLGTNRRIVDELILNPAPPTPQQIAAGTTVGLLPPPGTVFAPEYQDAVARVPQYLRGAFKISENDTPRPTTRAYLTYNFYDNLLATSSGFGTPRIVLHQQMLGYEQAFADRQFSVGIRLPYNQLVAPNFINDTGLGDLTLIGKAVLLENRETGNLLSGGLVVTAPTAASPFLSTLTGQNIRSTLIQPYLGYIYRFGQSAFIQGFSSIVVPTESEDVTFIANDISAGFFAYQNPGNWLSAVVPVFELHINNPLNHRGFKSNPVGFGDIVTMLGGVHAMFHDRAGLGFAAGSPVTGPRPFNLQATMQFNWRF